MALHVIKYQLANGPTKWSFKNAVENVKRRTRQVFRVLLGKKHQRGFFEHTPTYRTYRFPQDYLKFRYRRLFNFFEYGLFRRAANWTRNSLASAFTKRSGHRVFRGSGGPAVCFVGFVLASKPSLLTEQEEVEGLSFQIRETFSKVPLNSACFQSLSCPSSCGFDDLEVGSLLAKGCNAAVYVARWKHPQSEDREETGYFDLALKVMFNYSAQSDAAIILKTMYKEALPAIHALPFEKAGLRNKRIPFHPNIVEMYCAFADDMHLLEDALIEYPHALPFRITKEGYGRNMTLFLVMKRYYCSLKDYLKERDISTHTSLLLLCQLLEGIVHLQQHGFVHRDLKTDNILVDLTYGEENPVVAITDFGCCLDDLKLPYTTDEVDRGGNLALMAPEVVTATPGPFSVIDYSRSDLWTLGTIAYEIFGGKNPFYLSDGGYLESSAYLEEELPPLPPATPLVIQNLVKDMLRRDPKLRPMPSLAATICQLLLNAPPKLLLPELDCKKLAHWMFCMSTMTYLRATVEENSCQSLKHQLLHTFCRRIQFPELVEASKYISQM